MEISTNSSTSMAQIKEMAALSALKRARDAPGEAVLKVIEGVAEQAKEQGPPPGGSTGRLLNARA